MAIVLGYDTTFVAIHHLVRIRLLLAGLPFLLKFAVKRSQQLSKNQNKNEKQLYQP